MENILKRIASLLAIITPYWIVSFEFAVLMALGYIWLELMELNAKK